MSAPSFSKDTPNKISDFINVSGRNTLIKTVDNGIWRLAIADESIDAKVDGKKMFCVRVDNAGDYSCIMIGFTPMETFDSNKEEASFGDDGFDGCGIYLLGGNLYYPVDKYHEIINWEISGRAKEIIVILTISDNGKKKEIRFLCDGHESEASDVSEYLKGDRVFPAIVLWGKNEQVTTIPIDQIEIRTPEIENLIKESRNNREEKSSELETKKENKKEKKVKQVATKKTKKETKPKTTKATKKKEENKNNKNEKKTKAKK
jgi:hypothetical protein